MNGGYVMFDCMGLDLSKSAKQTFTGIYANANAAFNLGKPVFAYNCNYDGAEFTPVPVMCHKSGTSIIASAGVLQVWIGEDDGCTVVNLTAAE